MLQISGSAEGVTTLPTASSVWSSHTWRAFQSIGFSQTYPPGAELFTQGRPVRTIGLIEEGLVKLTRWASETDDVTVGIRTAGWPLGSAAALLQVPHILTAETLTRCQVLVIPADGFLRLVATDECTSADLHHIHAWELVDYVSHLAGVGALSARDRLLGLVSAALAKDAPDAAGPVRVTLPLKYSEVARAVMTTRQNLARVLKQLEKENLIVRQKGWLVVPDPARFWSEVRSHT